jgi:hypothetical protein
MFLCVWMVGYFHKPAAIWGYWSTKMMIHPNWLWRKQMYTNSPKTGLDERNACNSENGIRVFQANPSSGLFLASFGFCLCTGWSQLQFATDFEWNAEKERQEESDESDAHCNSTPQWSCFKKRWHLLAELDRGGLAQFNEVWVAFDRDNYVGLTISTGRVHSNFQWIPRSMQALLCRSFINP